MSGICDVIIPVHNQGHWAALCLRELLANTPAEAVGRILLVDDASAVPTRLELERLAACCPQAALLTLPERGGFARAVNRAIEETSAPYVLLLNSDCLLTRDALPKLITHCQADPGVGLVSPFSNSSDPLTLPIFDGWTYQGMNALLGERFAGKRMEACTIVGHALLATRECLKETGPFDDAYGLGYGEETDYQLRAMQKGFSATAALDTYVYHHGGASFAGQREAQRREGFTRFLLRWGAEYQRLARQSPPRAPRQRILRDLEAARMPRPEAEVLFVLPGIHQDIGGCHVAIDIANAAARAGMNVQIASLQERSLMRWSEPLLLSPLCFRGAPEMARAGLAARQVIATAWNTAAPAAALARTLGVPCHYFVQGYEFYFEAGRNYGEVGETFQRVDSVLTTSEWLKRQVEPHWSGDVTVLPPGIDEALFNARGRERNPVPRVCAALRGSTDKGQPILIDTLHRLAAAGGLELCLLLTDDLSLPSWVSRSEVHTLPLPRAELAAILKRSDILLDASLHEGFGMLPLEAVACGCAVVVSDSGGVGDFVEDGVNGIIVKEVNRPERYAAEVRRLLDDRTALECLQRRGPESVARFASGPRMAAWLAHLSMLATDTVRRTDGAVGAVRVRVTRLSPPQGDLEERVGAVERAVTEIYESRVWRALCGAGAAALAVKDALLKPFQRSPR